MEQTTKIGILKYIAGKGAKGVKFEDELDTWYNPTTDECKEQVKEEYKGKRVEITIAEGTTNRFTSMKLIGTAADQKPEVEEEIIDLDDLEGYDEAIALEEAELKATITTPEEPKEEPKEVKQKQLPVAEKKVKATKSVEVIQKEEEPTFIPTTTKNSISVKNTDILTKLGRIQQELKAPKSQKNTFANFSYRNISDIFESLKPFLAKYNVTIVLTDCIKLVGDRIYIEATAKLYDNDTGSSVESKGWAREQEEKKGMDAAQITGSSSSYARKYALNGLFAIDDTKDIDSQNNTLPKK